MGEAIQGFVNATTTRVHGVDRATFDSLPGKVAEFTRDDGSKFWVRTIKVAGPSRYEVKWFCNQPPVNQLRIKEGEAGGS